MIFQYPKINKTTQILKDLISINNDRISGYEAALNYPVRLDHSIRGMMKELIEDGVLNTQQLLQKAKQLDGETKTLRAIPGKIYMAWNDLKATFPFKSQKSLIRSFLYNEEIVIQVYTAALNKSAGKSLEVYQLLSDQENSLRKHYNSLKSCGDLRLPVNSSVTYFF
jgi:nucleoside diphosphate kinase